MKFAMFFMAEYANMITVGCVATLLFLGGWTSPFGNLIPVRRTFCCKRCFRSSGLCLKVFCFPVSVRLGARNAAALPL